MDGYLIISAILSVIYFCFILYYFSGWIKLNEQTALSENRAHLPFVTVLIPTRNEQENIQACIQSVLTQSYPATLFEVIVIDDYSTDSTIRLAQEINSPYLKVLNLMKYFGDAGEYVPNKKKALTIGIKNAVGDLIITTDGDCIVPENWLLSMVSFYQENNYKLITAPVLLSPAKGLLQLFQQIDVINMVGIAAGSIAHHYSTMCNGANLLYEKKAFLEVDGYKGNTEIPTGDDLFLMHKIEQLHPQSIGFCKDERAIVLSKPESTLTDFIHQRIRWASKSTGFQKRGVSLHLLLVYLCNLFILIFALLAFQKEEYSWLPLAILGGTKVFCDFVFNVPVLHFYKKKMLLFLFPIFECFHIVYIVTIGVLGLSGKYHWKDRKVGKI